MVIAIIGGGLAGLSVAIELDKNNIPFKLFEKEKSLGGKLRTIDFEGFKLDMGFQVLLQAYPNLMSLLTADELEKLKPSYFDAGSILLKDSKKYTLADPFREPHLLLDTLFCPLLTFKDKLLTLRLKLELMRFSLLEVFDNPQFAKQTTLEALGERGFSKNFINHFIKPFFGGVFGEDSLKTSFANFAFCYKAFSEDSVFLPPSGVGAFIEALAHKLPQSSIKKSKGVAKIQNNDDSVSLLFEDGSTENFEAAILALEAESLFKLLNLEKVQINRTVFTNLYFLSDVSLNTAKKIFLNSNNNRLISFGAEISSVCNDLLPKGESRHLISVTILSEFESEGLVKTAQEELENLFPHTKNHLRYLKSFSIRGASSLFKQDPESKLKLANLHQDVKKVIPQKVFLAGEFCSEACSQEHAVLSGKKAALEYLSSI